MIARRNASNRAEAILQEDAKTDTTADFGSEANLIRDRLAVKPIRIAPDISPARWQRIVAVVQEASPETWATRWAALGIEFASNAPDAAAVALLLRDWVVQGWAVSFAESALWLVPPRTVGADGESPATVKRRLRSWLEAAREGQLADPAVQAFFRRMETVRRRGSSRVSVLSLIDDGADLAAQLSNVSKLPPGEIDRALLTVVKPRLEIIATDSIDSVTGLRLIDVWRYFRHTWSMKYRPTPGRTLLFLLRNEARPNRPIMGIGALANPTLQITTRDDYIGWSTKALLKRVARDPAFWMPLREAMLLTIKRERDAIRKDDLLKQVGKARGVDLERRLLSLAEEAEEKRAKENRDRARASAEGTVPQESLRQLPKKKSGEIDWRKASTSWLFVAKRAKLLSQLLFAERILRSARSVPSAEDLCRGAEVSRALTIGAREIRKVGLASRLLELNVCGAVPPYNDLLVGKLTALAANAAEIRAAYAQRYSSQPSEIASQMSGREVYRSVDMCLITTTSLYGVSSSQYNRLNLDVGTADGARRIRWVEIGATLGQGTAQFSDDTTSMLRAAAVKRAGSRRVNNVFGEGQSPLLRQVREALSELGLPEDLLQHGSPRRMYVLELFPEAREALVLNAHRDLALPSFDAIAAAWVRRWLSTRIAYAPALQRIASVRPNSVAQGLRGTRNRQLESDMEERQMPVTIPEQSPEQSVSGPQLVRGLYRSLAACADHHDENTVALLHIETAVDSFLRLRAPKRGVIFVTGNPGDGKTHLLKHLSPDLTEAGLKVILDANQLSDEALAESIEKAYSGRSDGAVLAINEGVLVSLLDRYSMSAWAKGVKQYLLAPFWYRATPVPLDPRVCVIDLNLRNNLAPSVLRRAVRLLRSLSVPCRECPKQNCSLYLNSSRLRAESSEQIVRVLDSIGRTGRHATMRDVHGFLAFMFVGSLSCEEIVQSGLSPEFYWRNAFEGGQGHLFEAVRRLDPVRNADPMVDDALWRSADEPSNWIEPPVSDPRSAGDFESRVEAFRDRKRQALFEYRGAEHLATTVSDGVDRLLGEILEGSGSSARKLVGLLNRFFDRDEISTDVLFLWVTHRFDAHPPRFAAASDSVPVNSLEVLRPKIRPELEEAFPDFQPSHVILAHKDGSAEDGLRIDRPLLSSLLDAANGLPTSFRRGEPETRIAAFYERLRYRLSDVGDSTVYVKLVDRDTGSNHRIAVDIKGNTFVQS